MQSINTPKLDSHYYIFIGDILFHNVTQFWCCFWCCFMSDDRVRLHLGHVQAHTSGPTFCYGFQVERHVSWKRCAMVCNRVLDTFSLVWWVCQKCQPNQQQNVYKPRGIKETARTMDPSKVIYNGVRCSCQQLKILIDKFVLQFFMIAMTIFSILLTIFLYS